MAPTRQDIPVWTNQVDRTGLCFIALADLCLGVQAKQFHRQFLCRNLFCQRWCRVKGHHSESRAYVLAQMATLRHGRIQKREAAARAGGERRIFSHLVER